MKSGGIALKVIHSDDPLSSPLGADLRALQARIVSSEGDGVIARWEFGKKLLRWREGKQLPKGLAAAIIAEHHISRTELTYRMQCAEQFSTRQEVVNALITWPSWRQFITNALPKLPKRAAKTPRGNVWRILRDLADIQAHRDELSAADVTALHARLLEVLAALDRKSK